MTEAAAEHQNLDGIRTRPCPHCPLCGATGEPFYAALRDRQFGAPGEWRMVRCPNPECGLLWLDPMPLPEDIGKAYRSYYTHETVPSHPRGWKRFVYSWPRDGYLALRHGYPIEPPVALKRALGILMAMLPDRREYLDLRVMHLRAVPGGRLLDVGCGSGRFIRLMAELGWNAEGLDFDPRAVEAARRDGLAVRLGGLEEQGYPPGSFDAVTMDHVIEHVPAPLDLLRECHRILAPGGQLTIATPNATSWGHQHFRDAWRGLEPPRHLQVFSPRSLRSALERVGFPEPEVRTSPRIAAMIYRESLAPPGAVGAGTVPPAHAGAFWFKLREFARMKRDRECGEEVIAVARREGSLGPAGARRSAERSPSLSS